MSTTDRWIEPQVCWALLTKVLSYGHTLPFNHPGKKAKDEYVLSDQKWFGYHDTSSAQYLLEDIQHALFAEGCEKIVLYLDGRDDGPIIDRWEFTFTKDGLVEAYNMWNAD